MRLTRLFPVAGAALALALTTTACGDSTGANTITLSDTEVSQLFSEIADALSQAGVAQVSNPNLFLSVVPSINFNKAESIDETVNCNNGGSIHVSGSASASADFTTFSANVTEAFNACKTTSFTIGGSITADLSGGSDSFTETVKGSLSVDTNDGRSGTCSIDLKLTLNNNSASVSGTICGKDANAVTGLTA